MIRRIHSLLVSNRLTRTLQRRIVASVKNSMGVSDAYMDIAGLIHRHAPDVVLDIGCHVGKTIERIAESSSVEIHGFEPTPDSFEIAERKFSKNPLVHIHNFALADRNGRDSFFVNSNEQTNSLLDNAEGNHQYFPDATSHKSRIDVEIRKLDDWVQQTSPNKKFLIKSDIQGAESLLLEGGIHTFSNSVIAFYSEIQLAPMYEHQAYYWDVDQEMRRLGFALCNIYPCMHDKSRRALQADALWVHNTLLE